jgi:hypothetical protein
MFGNSGSRTIGRRDKARRDCVMSKPAVEAHGLRKAFGEVQALDGAEPGGSAGWTW